MVSLSGEMVEKIALQWRNLLEEICQKKKEEFVS